MKSGQNQLLVIVQDAGDEVKKQKRCVARVRTSSETDLRLTMMQVAVEKKTK